MKNTILIFCITTVLNFYTLDLFGQKTATITFFANITTSLESFPGHIWVEVDNGTVNFNYGFYASDNDPNTLDGLISDKYRKADVSYTFKITDASFKKTIKVIQKYIHSDYIIGINDCRMFAKKMAVAAGLKAPKVGLQSPAEWMAELVEAN